MRWLLLACAPAALGACNSLPEAFTPAAGRLATGTEFKPVPGTNRSNVVLTSSTTSFACAGVAQLDPLCAAMPTNRYCQMCGQNARMLQCVCNDGRACMSVRAAAPPVAARSCGLLLPALPVSRADCPGTPVVRRCCRALAAWSLSAQLQAHTTQVSPAQHTWTSSAPGSSWQGRQLRCLARPPEMRSARVSHMLPLQTGSARSMCATALIQSTLRPCCALCFFTAQPSAQPCEPISSQLARTVPAATQGTNQLLG